MPDPILKRSTLIAFEGIDGSGKTSVANLLVKRFGEHGIDAVFHANRTLRPVREVLEAVAHENGHRDRFEMFGADETQFMAALLKWRELLELAPALERRNHVVVVDRYVYNQFALAIAHATANLPLVRRLFDNFPAPDVVLFLDLEPGLAKQRIDRRGRGSDSLEYLTRLRAAYGSLSEFDSFQRISATAEMTAAEVLEDVWKKVLPLVSDFHGVAQ